MLTKARTHSKFETNSSHQRRNICFTRYICSHKVLCSTRQLEEAASDRTFSPVFFDKNSHRIFRRSSNSQNQPRAGPKERLRSPQISTQFPHTSPVIQRVRMRSCRCILISRIRVFRCIGRDTQGERSSQSGRCDGTLGCLGPVLLVLTPSS